MKIKSLFILLVLALLSAACTPAPSQAPPPAPAESQPASNALECTPVQSDAAPISESKLYVEFNSTDKDLGIHGYMDDAGWTELCVYNPSGELMLMIKPQAQLGKTTIASVFFEGREPSLEEFGFEELKSFPEGQYAVHGLSHDGTSVAGEATFSRNVPAPPELVYPVWAEEERAGDVVVPSSGFNVEWKAVTETTDGNP